VTVGITGKSAIAPSTSRQRMLGDSWETRASRRALQRPPRCRVAVRSTPARPTAAREPDRAPRAGDQARGRRALPAAAASRRRESSHHPTDPDGGLMSTEPDVAALVAADPARRLEPSPEVREHSRAQLDALLAAEPTIRPPRTSRRPRVLAAAGFAAIDEARGTRGPVVADHRRRVLRRPRPHPGQPRPTAGAARSLRPAQTCLTDPDAPPRAAHPRGPVQAISLRAPVLPCHCP
jgi:hypothetical protein